MATKIQERADKSKASRAVDAENAAAARERRAGEPERIPNKRSRLPHGAHFELDYDAHAVRWFGVLCVGEHEVEVEAGALITAIRALDEKMRHRLGIDADGNPVAAVHHGCPDLACTACGTDSTVGCIAMDEP